MFEVALQQLADLVLLSDTTGLLTGEEDIYVQGVNVAVQRETQRQRQLEFLQHTNNPVDIGIMGMKGRGAVLRSVSQTIGLDGEEVVPSDDELAQEAGASRTAERPEQAINQRVDQGIQAGVQAGVQKISSELTAGFLASQAAMPGGAPGGAPGGSPPPGGPPGGAPGGSPGGSGGAGAGQPAHAWQQCAGRAMWATWLGNQPALPGPGARPRRRRAVRGRFQPRECRPWLSTTSNTARPVRLPSSA